MALPEDIIFTDPVLQRALFDGRRFAPKPGHEAIVNILLYDITELTPKFQKVRDIAHAEAMQRHIRRRWFEVRAHSDGYFLDLPGGHVDGCQHVAAFEHAARDGAFLPDFRKRAALWHRYARRSPPPWL